MMKVELTVVMRLSDEVAQILSRIEGKLDAMADTAQELKDAMTELQASVAKNNDLEDSALQAIHGLNDQIKSLTDAAAAAGASTVSVADLKALTASIDGEASKLAGAITTGTPTPAAGGTDGTTPSTTPIPIDETPSTGAPPPISDPTVSDPAADATAASDPNPAPTPTPTDPDATTPTDPNATATDPTTDPRSDPSMDPSAPPQV